MTLDTLVTKLRASRLFVLLLLNLTWATGKIVYYFRQPIRAFSGSLSGHF